MVTFATPNFPPSVETFAVDYETTFKKGVRDIGTLGTVPYLRNPDTKIYLVSIYGVFAGGEVLDYCGSVEGAPWDRIDGKHWVSHNAAFDAAVFMETVSRGQITGEHAPIEWDCTANLAAFNGSGRSLAAAVPSLLGGTVDKTVRDQMNGQTWETMTPEFQAASIAYARLDAQWCWKLWQGYGPSWPAQEVAESRRTMIKSLHGVAVDLDYVEKGISELKTALWNCEQSIPWSGTVDAKGKEVTIGSKRALAAACIAANIPPPTSTADKNEAFDKWIAQYEDQAPFVRAVKDHRSINRTIDVLEKFRKRTMEDGRMPYGVKYFGAHCVTGDHEVLTKSGWVRIDEWMGGDIAQWSPDGAVQFLPAVANKFKNEQPLLRLDAPYVAGVFTAGHTIPYFTHGTKQFQTRTAEQAAERGSYYAPVSGQLTSSGQISANQIRILVAVQADGHWTDGGDLQFCLRKTRKIDRIQSILSLAGIPHRLQEFPSTPGQIRVTVSRRHCPAWLSQDRKKFGPWLLDTTEEAREAFAIELAHWDGWRHSTNPQYYSSIRTNCEWVATMLHLTGRSCGKISSKKGGYSLCARQTSEGMVFKKHWSPATPVDSVYCPTTQTGFWLYRFRDKIAITGNTGRPSGESGLNLFNLTKKKVAGVDIRGCIYPAPGKKFIVADLKQIEARVSLWFAGDWKQLELLRNGMDVYEAHARATMGYTRPEALADYVKSDACPEKDRNLRQIAKARVLGLGFGMGHVRLIEYAKAQLGLVLTVQQAKTIVNGFRTANPGIVKFWYKLSNAMEAHCVGPDRHESFRIELPSWRSLEYYDVNMAEGLQARDEIGGHLTHWFGGKLAENCLAGDTEVLTDKRGWVSLDSVTSEDRVWDGVEWVNHDGLSHQGEQETIDFGGVRLTPDHKVLVNGRMVPACETTHAEAA